MEKCKWNLGAMLKQVAGYLGIKKAENAVKSASLESDMLTRIRDDVFNTGMNEELRTRRIEARLKTVRPERAQRIRRALSSPDIMEALYQGYISQNQNVIERENLRLNELRNAYGSSRIDTGNPLFDNVTSNAIREAPFIALQAAAVHAIKGAAGLKYSVDAMRYAVDYVGYVRAYMDEDPNMTLAEAAEKTFPKLGISVGVDRFMGLMSEGASAGYVVEMDKAFSGEVLKHTFESNKRKQLESDQ